MSECKFCGKITPKLIGRYCCRCNKILGEVNADLVADIKEVICKAVIRKDTENDR